MEGKVDRTDAFTSQGGPGLRPPKGYGRSGRAARYGPQAGEGASGLRPLIGDVVTQAKTTQGRGS